MKKINDIIENLDNMFGTLQTAISQYEDIPNEQNHTFKLEGLEEEDFDKIIEALSDIWGSPNNYEFELSYNYSIIYVKLIMA